MLAPFLLDRRMIQLMIQLASSVFVIGFMFYVDEGGQHFEWLAIPAERVAFLSFVSILFAIQVVLFKWLPKEDFNFLNRLIGGCLGGIIGLFALVILWGVLLTLFA